jgi:hypothetical protein
MSKKRAAAATVQVNPSPVETSRKSATEIDEVALLRQTPRALRYGSRSTDIISTTTTTTTAQSTMQ